MKRYILILVGTILTTGLVAQKGWWKVDDWAVEYKLPQTWISNPFEYSSVCDCPGTINDNGLGADSLFTGMVIYPIDLDERRSDNRKQIWGHYFHKDGALEIVEYNGIEFQRTEGSLNGMDSNKAWQLISIDKPKKNQKHLIIYFWSHPSTFGENQVTFEDILKSMKRIKT